MLFTLIILMMGVQGPHLACRCRVPGRLHWPCTQQVLRSHCPWQGLLRAADSHAQLSKKAPFLEFSISFSLFFSLSLPPSVHASWALAERVAK